MGIILVRQPRKLFRQKPEFIFKHKAILFHSHLGLGDQIVCNGIVHWLAKTYKRKVFVACKQKNYANIDFLYKDFEDIIPLTIPTNPIDEHAEVQRRTEDRNLDLIKTCIPFDDMDRTNYWDQGFYDILHLDYPIKYTYCSLPSVNEEEIISEHLKGLGDYAFVHDDPMRDLTYAYETELPIIKNQLELNIFEMGVIMRRAKELHMMASSLICLADLMRLPLKNQKAYLYTFRGNVNFRGAEKWIKKDAQ